MAHGDGRREELGERAGCTWPPSASERVCVSFEFLNMASEQAIMRSVAEGGAEPVWNVLLFCCQCDHDIVQRTQTPVDVHRLHSSDAFRAAFGYVF
jgi:hypothetical protein